VKSRVIDHELHGGATLLALLVNDTSATLENEAFDASMETPYQDLQYYRSTKVPRKLDYLAFWGIRIYLYRIHSLSITKREFSIEQKPT
jgi:hypothetical protein